jgi:hypothetical protein
VIDVRNHCRHGKIRDGGKLRGCDMSHLGDERVARGAPASGGIRATVLATILATISPNSHPQATAEPSLRWGECPDLGLPTPGPECATLEAPLDYRDPGGTTISLAVSRLPSTDPAKRRGVMLMNPGGPGLSMPIGMVNAGLPASVRESFDLIGFDPARHRVQLPVRCALPPQLQIGNAPTWARDATDIERRAAVVREIARQCGTGPSGRSAANIWACAFWPERADRAIGAHR